jgi:hypothetical protein
LNSFDLLNSNTAILFFSLDPESQAKAKAFSDTGDNISISRTLIEKTQRTLRKTGLPVFHYNQDNQIGETFGSRLSNAIQSVYDEGFEKVIVVGNDSPNITKGHILGAVDELSENDLVLGPTYSKGLFLIGICEDAFDKGAFEKMDWQSQNIITDIESYGDLFASDILWLTPLFEINTQKDFHLLWLHFGFPVQ